MSGFTCLARGVVDAELGRDAGGHVVVHDIGRGDELERDREAAGVFDVERDVALAALAPEERLRRHAHAVAGDGFDLDDLGAEIAR